MHNLTQNIDPNNTHWRGYTLSELRYRRAYIQVKLEMERATLFNKSKNIVNDGVLPLSGSSKNILAKAIGALDYFDYAFIAYKTGAKIIHILKAFRRRK